MPTYTRGKKRDNLVFVSVSEFMYFGFKPKKLTSIPGITDAEVTAIGHIESALVFKGKFRIIGAKAPQPPKVIKKINNVLITEQKSVSTYCGYDVVSSARQNGWNLIKPRKTVILRALSGFHRSLTAIATTSDGLFYCFPMNKADFELFGTELGLESSIKIKTDFDRKKLVSGSSLPFPGKATKKLNSGGTFSSFFSTAKQKDILQIGYTLLNEEKVLPLKKPPF